MNKSLQNPIQTSPIILMVWKGIKKEYRECYQSFLKLAESIYEQREEVIDLPKCFKIEQLKPAVSAGVVGLEKHRVKFINQEVRLWAIAQYVLENKVLPVWDDHEQFVNVMLEVQRKGYELNEEELASKILVLLHNENGKDVKRPLVRVLATVMGAKISLTVPQYALTERGVDGKRKPLTGPRYVVKTNSYLKNQARTSYSLQFFADAEDLEGLAVGRGR